MQLIHIFNKSSKLLWYIQPQQHILGNTSLNSHLGTYWFLKIRWNELGQTSIHFPAPSSMYHPIITFHCIASTSQLQLLSVGNFCPWPSEGPSPQFWRYPPWECQKPWQRCCSLLLLWLPRRGLGCRVENLPPPNPLLPVITWAWRGLHFPWATT